MIIDYKYMFDRWEYSLTEEEKRNETKEDVKDFFEVMRWMAEGTGMDAEQMTDDDIESITEYVMKIKEEA